MSYKINFSDEAKDDILFHKKSGNAALVKKIKLLLNDIAEHPFIGIGKPELLKYELNNKWPRRINHEHRLVYEVTNNFILIHSLRGHYS